MLLYYVLLDPLILVLILLTAAVWKVAVTVISYCRRSAASREVRISRAHREEVSRPKGEKNTLQTVVSPLAGKQAKISPQHLNHTTRPKYDTLEYADEIEFRLIDIELYRKDNTEPLKCRQRKTTAANAGAYYALSYCWNHEALPLVLRKGRSAHLNAVSLSVNGQCRLVCSC